MRRDDLKSDLMLRYWRRVEIGHMMPDTLEVENAKAEGYNRRISGQIDAMLKATESLIALEAFSPSSDVAEVVLKTEHRTHQADIVRSAFKIIAAFANTELGVDSRNEDAIILCKDVMEGYGDRIGFIRI